MYTVNGALYINLLMFFNRTGEGAIELDHLSAHFQLSLPQIFCDAAQQSGIRVSAMKGASSEFEPTRAFMDASPVSREYIICEVELLE